MYLTLKVLRFLVLVKITLHVAMLLYYQFLIRMVVAIRMVTPQSTRCSERPFMLTQTSAVSYGETYIGRGDQPIMRFNSPSS
jgi:hypothetical protein